MNENETPDPVETDIDLRGQITAANSVAAAAAREFQQLEVEHTALQEQHAKLQQQAASFMLGNKQLKGAVSRLDAVVTYLVACVASNPVEPAQGHAALNVLALSLRKTQEELGKSHGIIALMRKKLSESVKPDGKATIVDSDGNSKAVLTAEVDKPS